MKIKPLSDRVVIKRLEAQSVTAGGIIIPDASKEAPKEGKVVAVGDGKRIDDGTLLKMSLKVGDHVLFTSYAGTEIEVSGDKLVIMSEEDVIGKLE